MARIVLRPDLGAVMAQQHGTRLVDKLKADVAERVRRNAPPARVWVSAADERVRPAHRDADSQTIPGNLRFQLDDTGRTVLARAPRDPGLPIGLRINCRCQAAEIPGVIARTVAESSTTPEGESVKARVSVTFPRIVESEHPGDGDRGGGWFARAVREASNKHGGGV